MGNIHKALTFVLHNIVHMIWLVFCLLFTSTWVFVHNYEDFFFCLNHEQLYSSFSYPCYWKKLDFIFFLPLFKPSIFHYSIFVIEKKNYLNSYPFPIPIDWSCCSHPCWVERLELEFELELEFKQIYPQYVNYLR